MLQVSLDLQLQLPAMLQIGRFLLQNDAALQQNTRIGPSVKEWRPPAQEAGRLRSGEMLQVEPVLQQNKRGMLQIWGRIS